MSLRVRAPGRVVLFGEHQDYLHLPVIPMAIDKYITIEGIKYSKYEINLKDFNQVVTFEPSNVEYESQRDYLRSCVKVLQDDGIISNNSGAKVTIKGTIPIQAGLSSSSALCVAWVKFLSINSGHDLTKMEVTLYAHKAEVLEFNEPGGMQDHMASAFGYINYEEFNPIRCSKLGESFSGIVVGNSLERKPTLNTLSRVKSGVYQALYDLNLKSVKDITASELVYRKKEIEKEENFRYLLASVKNHEITVKARKEMNSAILDSDIIGNLMNTHQCYLKDYLNISTTRIDLMIDEAIKAGALGCKITGSGNGGCFIAYCPNKEVEVIKAIEKMGLQAFHGVTSPGVSWSIDK